MLGVSFKLEGLEEAKKMLSPKKVKYAIGNTINDLARLDVKDDLQGEMKRAFNKPTPQIINGIYTKFDRQELSVRIGFKDSFYTSIGVEEIMRPHILGGTRQMKRSETYFRNYYVPGAGARLNQYGNIPGSEIEKILSTVRALPETGYTANITAGTKALRKRTKRFRDIFWIRYEGRNLKPGIYEKKGGKVIPLLIFIKSPFYKVRYHYHDVARRSIEENAQRRWNEAFRREFTAK